MRSKLFLFTLISAFIAVADAQAFTWQGIFIAGDDSIDNFDHSREDLSAMFSSMAPMETIHLSSSQKFISDSVFPATLENIWSAFANYPVNTNEGCLVHMSSHGARGRGFYLSLSGIMDPAFFAAMVDAKCGDQPTVILVSACFSGQFITQELAGPNRIILTAASAERPSFGCSADTHYTYWDGCLIEELPRSHTWYELYHNVRYCIAAKEAALGVPSSEPQAYFGEYALDWMILGF